MTAEIKPKSFTPYDEQVRRALICDADPAAQKFFGSAFAALKMKPEAASTIEQVMESVKYNQYEVVLVNDRFSVNPRGENEAIGFFQELPMSTRRSMLLVLVGDAYTTLDNLAAYGKGVNLVVNTRDLQSLPTIVAKSMADNERFFRALRETLGQRGRN